MFRSSLRQSVVILYRSHDQARRAKPYCEIGKLHEQLDSAEEKGDAKEFEALVAELDSLEQQMGSDYIRVTDGLGEVEPNSAEGQKFSAVFEPLRKQCREGRIKT